MLGIGIDTGGTCTDAVIYDFDAKAILGYGKTLTTRENLETGIAAALDQLPQDLLKKAEIAALSTTLATNACMEDKGARAKLLMIGFHPETVENLKDTYAAYGLKDLSKCEILDGKVEGVYQNAYDPDWNDLRKRAAESFGDADSVGIVQMHPRSNGGRFERTAYRILKEALQVPITVSYEISNETDILKTAAGTMLNARLIPLIDEFMQAVRNVMEERGLHIPLSIVRSDGTVMSEEMAQRYPVETILCGPAASVVGGSALAGCEDGIVVDMGGTTTDIAIVRGREPVLADGGIRIGQWKTMVKGLYADTFGLGGDTAVRFKKGRLYLDTVRVIPLCVLASRYDHVIPSLRELIEKKRAHSRQLHEFFVLVKDISAKSGYTAQEYAICEALREKPLISLDLSERMGRDLRFLDTSRLEEEGVIIKSGLTPTDMMVIKGDYTEYDAAAPLAAIDTLTANIIHSPEEIPDLVYEMVFRRMYFRLGRLLLMRQFKKTKAFRDKAYSDAFLEACYEQAKVSLDENRKAEADEGFAGLELSCRLPLIGVGAPIHVFLPRVAALLHTKALIPVYAKVANALGAAVSRKVLHTALVIKAEYEDAELKGFSVYEDGEKHLFEDQEEAVAFGKEVIRHTAGRWGALQGIGEDTQIEFTVTENRLGHQKDGILFEVVVHASVTETDRHQN